MALLALAGCAHFQPRRSVDQAVSSSPATPLAVPAGPPRTPLGEPPPELHAGAPLSLSALTDIALQRSPHTRAAWQDARVAAAQVGARASAYYPSAQLDLPLSFQRQVLLGGRGVSEVASLGPALGLSYLVLDLGGRAADVEEARQQLAIANFTHSAGVQDLVLRVAHSYYQVLSLKALSEAAAANLDEAQRALSAATERQRAGLATLADVLQAKTAASQALLGQRTTEGLLQNAKGGLASALGLAVTTELPVGELPQSLEVSDIGSAVEMLIAEAERQRPELAAARSQITRAEARAQSAWSSGLPSLVLAANGSRPYFLSPSDGPYADNYSVQLAVRVPLFTGFRDTYNQLQAEEAVGAARARAEVIGQQVALQVWTSYQGLKTAGQRLGAARDLLESARASAEVATGRYQAGAGTVIDLLVAQAALASARAQEVQSRADYLVALVSLAHDSGALGPGAGVGKP